MTEAEANALIAAATEHIVEHTIKTYDRRMARALREMADDIPASISGRQVLLQLADELNAASQPGSMN